MVKVATVQANSIRNSRVAAIQAMGDDPRVPSTRISMWSGGEDGLYRITLCNGNIIELTVKPRGRTIVDSVREE